MVKLNYRTDRKLLGSNTKLAKADGTGYLLRGLSMAPHTLGGLGFDACPSATVACRTACVLWFAGRSNSPAVRNAMVNRKTWFLASPATFLERLQKELDAHIRKATKEGLTPIARLNVASDLDWCEFISANPDCLFYDYTKVRGRFSKELPENYQLTYSYNEGTPEGFSRTLLESGHNIAVVTNTRYVPSQGLIDPVPESFSVGGREFETVDGDADDLRLRERDGSSKVIILRFKGGRKKMLQAMEGGFCVSETGGIK